MFNNSIISFIYEQKNIIIGGVFVGFTIVSYFYKANILFRKKNELKRLKSNISKFKSAMAKKKTVQELEYDILENKIDKIASSTRLNNRMIIMQLNTEFEVVNIRLDGIKKSITDTDEKLDDFVDSSNKRIKKLEDDTEFIRASKKWKWVVGLALIGLITTINFSTVKAWLSKILPW